MLNSTKVWPVKDFSQTLTRKNEFKTVIFEQILQQVEATVYKNIFFQIEEKVALFHPW